MAHSHEKPMKFVRELPVDQRKELERLVKISPNHRVRQRAQAILLSARRYPIDTLADIFSVHRNTVSEWIDFWEADGVDSLQDAPRSGRPPALTEEQEQVLLAEIEKNPRSIGEALRALKKRPAR